MPKEANAFEGAGFGHSPSDAVSNAIDSAYRAASAVGHAPPRCSVVDGSHVARPPYGYTGSAQITCPR